ncbi:MAG: hypothetical protein ACK4GJ_01275 [bacterium]
MNNSWISFSMEIIKANIKPIVISSILASPIVSLLTLGTSFFVALALSVKIAQKIKESKENSNDIVIDDFNILGYYLKGFKIFFYMLGILAPFILFLLIIFLLGFSFLLRGDVLANKPSIFVAILNILYIFSIVVANVVRYYFLYLYDDSTSFGEIFKNVYSSLLRNITTSIFVIFISILLGVALGLLSPLVFFCSLTFLAMLPNFVADIIVLSYIGSQSIEEKV